MPESYDTHAGHPITVLFGDAPSAKDAEAILKNDLGKGVEFSISTPEETASEDYQRNTTVLIAKHPLNPATNNLVTVALKLGGNSLAQIWTFTPLGNRLFWPTSNDGI